MVLRPRSLEVKPDPSISLESQRSPPGEGCAGIVTADMTGRPLKPRLPAYTDARLSPVNGVSSSPVLDPPWQQQKAVAGRWTRA